MHPDGGAVRVGTPATAAAAATAACLPRLTAPPSLPVPPQLINRMLYRSRQRGFLELDLLIVRAGGWLAGWLVLWFGQPWGHGDAQGMRALPLSLHTLPLSTAAAHSRSCSMVKTGRRAQRSACHAAPSASLAQGMWAEKELPRMSGPEIAEFEAVLDQENPDMFKWLTGQVRCCLWVAWGGMWWGGM